MMDFSNYQIVRLRDAAEVERAQKGKIYPEGCTLIALSATKGQVEYMPREGEVDSRWAVVIPHEGNIQKYIYYSIKRSFPEFSEKYITGINLQMENLNHLEIALHQIEIQREVVRMLETVEQKEKKEEQKLNAWKDAKKYFLGKMFLINLSIS